MNESKEVMAANIKHYMELQNKTASEVCKALGIKQNTFSDWVNAKTYPRIDKIELMAKYFGVSKAHLVEANNRPDVLCNLENGNRLFIEVTTDRKQLFTTLNKRAMKLSDDDLNKVVEIMKVFAEQKEKDAALNEQMQDLKKQMDDTQKKIDPLLGDD